MVRDKMIDKENDYRRPMLIRAYVAAGIVSCAFLGLIVRLFWLQSVNYEKFRKTAFRQHWGKKSLPARRGEIYDRNGVLLAISQVGFSCYTDPKVVKDAKKTAEKLAPILEMDTEKLIRPLSHPRRRFVWLKRLLSKKKYEEIKKMKLRGIYFQKEQRRVYPNGKLAAHVLGFVGVDNRGLEGVEASFNPELSGIDGFTWVLKDGRLARLGIYSPEAPWKKPRHGGAVHLTIDINYQHMLEVQLERVMKEFGNGKNRPLGAAGILLQPKTGEILALASRPTYDPNEFGKYDRKSWRNMAIANAYELGSVMKPLVIAAGLTERVCSPNTVIFCHNGSYRAPGRGRPLKDTHRYGNLSVAEIVIKSSNIGSAIVGERLGKERLCKYLYRIGFGRKTGISLPGEAVGMLKPAHRWHKATISSVPMGHEITITPLQMATAYTTLAGDGYYRPPSIVKKIVYPNGKTAYKYSPKLRNRIYPARVAQVMREILRLVVEEGTAKRAKRKTVSIGGKTGTAQKIVNGRYSHSNHIAVFVGLAPTQNPEFCCLVMVDDPYKAHYGGTVSGPAVANVLEQAWLHKTLQKKFPKPN